MAGKRIPWVMRLLLALVVIAFAASLVGGVVYDRATRVVDLQVPSSPEQKNPGALYKAEQVGEFGALTFRALLYWAGLPEKIPVHSGAKLYRVQYWTTRYDGAATVASGLLAVPTQTPFRGIVSYQHGTRTNRHEAPSRPTLGEGVLAAAAFAGGGYVTAAPDYIGLGTSREVHPYLHAESAAKASVDLLRAAHALLAHLNQECPNTVYLMGFSQGGHATLAAHRLLEAMNDPKLRVAASASVSGVYDLAGISFPTALEGASAAHSLYLAYVVNAYCRVYGHPLDSVLSATWPPIVADLFDGEHDEDEVAATLPARPRDMFNADFLKDYDAGKPTWLLDALAQNQVLQWTPQAPVRLYVGDNDADVSPKEAQVAAAEFSKRGCDATLVSVGACGHEESILRAAPKVRAWFDELSAKPGQ